MALTANSIASAPTLSFVRSESKCQHRLRIGSCPSELNFGIQFHPFTRIRLKAHAINVKGASVICSAALSATCAAEQTQTVTRESSTITVAPIQGKEKSPELDDGGTGLPPRDDDGGGGGGGGGGGNWSGGFAFFGFLAFLGFLKDKESEDPYDDRRR
ncbi:hypothetical protein LIER_42049 [Lithospermum erythrorhizon]|uniref:Uncharacterized protein n=1 Tax=Lithospermum erythrorhizon TaxID=34254 RepID=A0AAV3RKE7_LITER